MEIHRQLEGRMNAITRNVHLQFIALTLHTTCLCQRSELIQNAGCTVGSGEVRELCISWGMMQQFHYKRIG